MLCVAEERVLELAQKLPLHEVASRVGMTPEAVQALCNKVRPESHKVSKRAQYGAARRQGFDRSKSAEVAGISMDKEPQYNSWWNSQFSKVKVEFQPTGESWVIRVQKGRSLLMEVREIPII